MNSQIPEYPQIFRMVLCIFNARTSISAGQSHHRIQTLKKRKVGCGGVFAPPQPHNLLVFWEHKY